MDGIIVINKPKGYTSHDIVSKVKKITREKVGHTGTLDPNATGVLPLLIGKGTKLSKYLINHDKKYLVTLKLGEKTDTADVEGNIVEEKKVDLTNLEQQNVVNVLNAFIGKQEQVPPMYSAIKIKGKKLYEYARSGEKIDVLPRNIEIYNIKLIKIDNKKFEIIFEVSCSKGTYIRSLCEDIAIKLNTLGYMKELKRIQVGYFNIENSITIEELEKNINNKEFIKNNFISFERVLKENKNIILNKKMLKLFYNGVKIQIEQENGTYKIYNEDNIFLGTGIVLNNLLKRDIIIKNIENN